MTVQEYVAPGFSTLPATSRARTRNVWLPRASPDTVTGEVQAVNGAVSSEQLNAEPGSLAVNVNVAAVAVVDGSGPPAPKEDTGGVVSGGSTVQVTVFAGDSLPAGSIALTANTWVPTGTSVYTFGDVHGV